MGQQRNRSEGRGRTSAGRSSRTKCGGDVVVQGWRPGEAGNIRGRRTWLGGGSKGEAVGGSTPISSDYTTIIIGQLARSLRPRRYHSRLHSTFLQRLHSPLAASRRHHRALGHNTYPSARIDSIISCTIIYALYAPSSAFATGGNARSRGTRWKPQDLDGR